MIEGRRKKENRIKEYILKNWKQNNGKKVPKFR